MQRRLLIKKFMIKKIKLPLISLFSSFNQLKLISFTLLLKLKNLIILLKQLNNFIEKIKIIKIKKHKIYLLHLLKYYSIRIFQNSF